MPANVFVVRFVTHAEWVDIAICEVDRKNAAVVLDKPWLFSIPAYAAISHNLIGNMGWLRRAQFAQLQQAKDTIQRHLDKLYGC